MKDKDQFFNRRRNVIKMLSFPPLLLSAPFVITPSRAAPKRIVVRDAGGLLSKAYAQVLYKPFKRTTGIEVIGATSDAEPIPQVRMMVETKRYQ